MAADTHPGAERVAQPVRTCIGCRKTSPLGQLVRLVLEGDRPVADGKRRLPGRGASLHPRQNCFDGALKKGGFARAFRRQVDLSASGEIWRQVEASLTRGSHS